MLGYIKLGGLSKPCGLIGPHTVIVLVTVIIDRVVDDIVMVLLVTGLYLPEPALQLLHLLLLTKLLSLLLLLDSVVTLNWYFLILH